MPNLTMPKDNLITVNTVELSDHGRQPLSITYDEVFIEQQLANGTIRRYCIGIRRTFSLTWEFLPALDDHTADGKAGRISMRDLFENGGAFTLGWRDSDGDKSTGVWMTSYHEELVKRWDDYYWNVTVELQEQGVS